MHTRCLQSVSTRRNAIRTAVMLAAIAAGAPAVNAATYTWIGGNSGDVNVESNWSPSGVPSSAAGDTVVFDEQSSGLLTLTNSGSVTGASGRGLTISVTSPSDITIDSAASLWRFANGVAITIAEGAGAFTMGDGNGSAVAYGVGNSSGQTHQFINNSSNVATLNSDIVFNGGGAGTHTLLFGGSGDWTTRLVVRNTSGLWESNGLFHITKTGSGTLTLTNAGNVYSGQTLIQGGTIRAASSTALGYGGQYTVGRELARTTVSGATEAARLDLAGESGDLVVNEPIVLDGAANGAWLINSSTEYNATIDNGIAAILLTKAGSVYGDVSWDKVQAIITGGEGSGATARVYKSGNSAAGLSHVYMTTPGSGYTSAPTVTLIGSGDNGDAEATAVVTSVTLNGTNNYIGGAGNLTINAVIGESEAGSGFTKVGAGTLTLAGANTYTGPTVISEGRLVLSGSLDEQSAITLESGAVLQITSATALSSGATLSLIEPTAGSIVLESDLSIGALYIDGILQPIGMYGADTAPAGLEALQSLFAGPGTLTIVAVPEPAAMAAMLAGSAGLLARRRRRN